MALTDTYTVDDYTFHLDMRAIDEVESVFDMGFYKLLDVFEARAKAKDIRLGEMAKFYRVCLVRNHPEITLEEAFEVAMKHPDALFKIITTAFPATEEGKEPATEEGKEPAKGNAKRPAAKKT